jgi:hypothetical protein
MPTKTERGRLKDQEQSRDLFCVIKDAFRIFARKSSAILGSAWAFTGAVVIILIWALDWTDLWIFGYVAAHHQYRNHHRHLLNGILDPEYAES